MRCLGSVENWIADLRERGIATVDLVGRFLLDKQNGGALYYPGSKEHHPADLGLRLAAEEISALLNRKKFCAKAIYWLN